MRYYEDITVGETHATDEYTVAADEVMEIAERFDPQPFHLDPAAAEDSVFGSLAASGVHTIGICQRLAVDTFHRDVAIAGGAGIDDPNFPRPTYAGATVAATLEVTGKRALDSYADIGLVRLHQTLTNEDDEIVVELTTLPLVRRREDTTDRSH